MVISKFKMIIFYLKWLGENVYILEGLMFMLSFLYFIEKKICFYRSDYQIPSVPQISVLSQYNHRVVDRLECIKR